MALNYVHILLLCEQLTFSSMIYFNNDNIAQECNTKIYTNAKCNGSNSLRVHEQLM